MDKKDMQFDSMIQKRIQSFLADTSGKGIEPSDDFAHKVMRDCINCERSRAKNINIFLIGLALLPFVLREIWMFIRSDFISVQTLPFGGIIHEIYIIVLSPLTAYILGFTGIAIATYIYFKRWRSQFMDRKIRV